MALGNRPLFLNDFEILGVGAQRKRKAQAQSVGRELVLKTHNHSFLPGLLEETLVWLRPTQVVPELDFDKPALLKAAFERIFSQSKSLLGDSSQKLLKDYLNEMAWDEGLLDDHFRYFSFFFHRRFPKETTVKDVLLWEWIQHSLTYQDFEPWPRLKDEVLLVCNPSLQIVRLEKDSEILQRERGLYGFVYSSHKNQVVEQKLGILEARVLDLLSEDRKFSQEQLIEMILTEEPSSKDQVLSSLAILRESDII